MSVLLTPVLLVVLLLVALVLLVAAVGLLLVALLALQLLLERNGVDVRRRAGEAWERLRRPPEAGDRPAPARSGERESPPAPRAGRPFGRPPGRTPTGRPEEPAAPTPPRPTAASARAARASTASASAAQRTPPAPIRSEPDRAEATPPARATPPEGKAAAPRLTKAPEPTDEPADAAPAAPQPVERSDDAPTQVLPTSPTPAPTPSRGRAASAARRPTAPIERDGSAQEEKRQDEAPAEEATDRDSAMDRLFAPLTETDRTEPLPAPRTTRAPRRPKSSD